MRKILRMGSRRPAPMRRILRIPMSRILRILERTNNQATKKEQPPADQPPSPVRFHVPPTTGPTARATDLAGQADELVRVIRDRLPDRLRAQLSTATLRTRAQTLASAGWTAQPLAVAVADRVWNGAHGGAVITWLTELANVGPPRAAPNNDSRTTTLRLRAEAARAKSAAAGADSPARAAARQLAAQLGRRRSS